MTTSVALCTYNGAVFLLEQLNSILNQTKTVDEIIICDDCSKDKTCDLIRQFIKTCPVKIKFVENSINTGYIQNFEQAISLCSGDIIFMSDQDDLWEPHKVATICHFFEKHKEKDFVFTDAELVNQWGVNSYEKTLFQVVGWNKTNKTIFDDNCEYDILSTSGRVTGATVAFRSSFLPYCIPFPQTWIPGVHDEMIAISAVLHNKIARIDECLIKYRLHEKQTVGLNIILKFPPKSWELALNTILWHESVSGNDRNVGMEKLQIVYKRFWIRHKCFSLLQFILMYIRGEYGEHYLRPYAVFSRDVKGIFVRFMNKIKQIPYLRVVDIRHL
jgi:glycosyltransferase involved in cell wall biosynthesis